MTIENNMQDCHACGATYHGCRSKFRDSMYDCCEVCNHLDPRFHDPNRSTSPAAAVNEALEDAIGSDVDLAEQSAGVDLVAAYNQRAASHPSFKPMTPDVLLALARGEQVMSAAEIVAATGLDPDQVRAFLDGEPDEEIEIPQTATHGFDDVFGNPTTDGWIS